MEQHNTATEIDHDNLTLVNSDLIFGLPTPTLTTDSLSIGTTGPEYDVSLHTVNLHVPTLFTSHPGLDYRPCCLQSLLLQGPVQFPLER